MSKKMKKNLFMIFVGVFLVAMLMTFAFNYNTFAAYIGQIRKSNTVIDNSNCPQGGGGGAAQAIQYVIN